MGFVFKLTLDKLHFVFGLWNIFVEWRSRIVKKLHSSFIHSFIHSFSILSDDRSKASSKTMPPHSAI